jgi:hypothetical protein
MKHLPALLAAAAVIVSSPAAAQETVEPRVFTRTGQWQLEAAENECRLARVFTNGTDQIALALERNRADNLVRLVLVSNALRTFRLADELGYRFLPAGDQRSARYIVSETADGQTYLNLGNALLGALPSPSEQDSAPPTPDGAPFTVPLYDRNAELDYAAAITGIEINAGLTAPVRLETGSLRSAITALQACTDDLLLTWGLDWEKHQSLTRRVTPVNNPWDYLPEGSIGFLDFPSFAGGRNTFRVMVNAEGRPTSCTVMWPSFDDTKNELICTAFIDSAQFLPALDAQGVAIDSYWVANFVFIGQIPSR